MQHRSPFSPSRDWPAEPEWNCQGKVRRVVLDCSASAFTSLGLVVVVVVRRPSSVVVSQQIASALQRPHAPLRASRDKLAGSTQSSCRHTRTCTHTARAHATHTHAAPPPAAIERGPRALPGLDFKADGVSASGWVAWLHSESHARRAAFGWIILVSHPCLAASNLGRNRGSLISQHVTPPAARSTRFIPPNLPPKYKISPRAWRRRTRAAGPRRDICHVTRWRP